MSDEKFEELVDAIVNLPEYKQPLKLEMLALTYGPEILERVTERLKAHNDLNLDLTKNISIEEKPQPGLSDIDSAFLHASQQGNLENIALLLEQGANINVQNNAGETALMIASKQNKAAVVKVLLDRKADMIKDNILIALQLAMFEKASDAASVIIDHSEDMSQAIYPFTLALFDNDVDIIAKLLEKNFIIPFDTADIEMMVLSKMRTNPRLHEVVRIHMADHQKKYTDMMKNENKLIAMPWLSGNEAPHQQTKEYLEQQLLNLSQTHPQITVKLNEFLEEEGALASDRFNRVGVVFEILKLIKHPYLLTQLGNYCGMVTILQLILVNEPEKFVDIALDLTSTGQSNRVMPLKASRESIDNAVSIGSFTAEVMRHQFNLLGYRAKSMVEPMLGATRPKRLVNLLERLNFTDIEDSLTVHSTSGKELPSLFRRALGGIYSDKHKDGQSQEEKLSSLMNAVQDKKNIIIHVSMNIAQLFLPSQEFEESDSDFTLMGIAPGHYVVLKDIHQVDSSNDLSLTVWSWGNEVTIQVPKETFLAGFRGMLVASSPEHVLQLSKDDEQPESSSLRQDQSEETLQQGHAPPATKAASITKIMKDKVKALREEETKQDTPQPGG